MSDEIKWNKDRHDDHAREDDKKRFKDRVKRMFDQWRRDLCSVKRTRDEVLVCVEELRLEFQRMVATVGNDIADPEYVHFTHQMLDSKAAEILADTFMVKNTITQYIPKYTADGSVPPEEGIILMADMKKKAAPKADFKNSSEFYKIGFVRVMAGKPGFLCFVRDNEWVRGVFKDGEVLPLGKLANLIGVDNMLTIEQFKSEVKKLPDTEPPGPAAPEAQPGSPGPASPDSFPA